MDADLDTEAAPAMEAEDAAAMDEDAALASDTEEAPARPDADTLELDPPSPAGSMEEGELTDNSEPEPTSTEVASASARRRRAARFGMDPGQADAEVDESRVLGALEDDVTQRRGARPVYEPPPPPPETVEQHKARYALYRSLDLPPPEDGPVYWRAEAVHMRGTGDMTTDDVMDYFRQFRPAHVEWVSDSSCNAVWLNHRGPVRAMLELSSPIIPAAKPKQDSADPDALLVGLDNIEDSDVADAEMRDPGEEEAVRQEDVGAPVPPGRWRLGVPHRLAPHLFMRFATRGDRQLPGVELHRKMVKLYGDPSHRGVAGIITERRQRELRGVTGDEPSYDDGRANPWSGIAATWATAEAVGAPPRQHDYDPELQLLQNGGRAPDLRRRITGRADRLSERTERPAAPLPRKRQHSSSPEHTNRSSGDEEEAWRARLKAPRMRMHADDENIPESVPVRTRKTEGDLRSRLKTDSSWRKNDDTIEGRWLKNSDTAAARLTKADDFSGDESLSSSITTSQQRERFGSPLSPRLDYEPEPPSPASPEAAKHGASAAAEEDDLQLSSADLVAGAPLNIKITRDFSGDEMSGSEESESDSEPESQSRPAARSRRSPPPPVKARPRRPASSASSASSGSSSDESESEDRSGSEGRSSAEVDVDRRTDRNSATDLRARLNRRRAAGAAANGAGADRKPAAKPQRPPLRIEVDNDEYYRLIGSESD